MSMLCQRYITVYYLESFLYINECIKIHVNKCENWEMLKLEHVHRVFCIMQFCVISMSTECEVVEACCVFNEINSQKYMSSEKGVERSCTFKAGLDSNLIQLFIVLQHIHSPWYISSCTLSSIEFVSMPIKTPLEFVFKFLGMILSTFPSTLVSPPYHYCHHHPTTTATTTTTTATAATTTTIMVLKNCLFHYVSLMKSINQM